MDYGKMLGESFGYAKEAVWGRWDRWVMLVAASIVFPLFSGYTWEVYRGSKPAPAFAEGSLFIHGLKMLVAGIIYAIPILIVLFATIGYAIFSIIARSPGFDPNYITNHPELILGILPGIILGIVITVIVAFVVALVSIIGLIRMARADRLSEAFHFSGIFGTIGKIGWGRYIVALIIGWIVTGIFLMILIVLAVFLPVLGWILVFVFSPPVSLFLARYVTMVYDCAESPVPSVPAEPVTPAIT